MSLMIIMNIETAFNTIKSDKFMILTNISQPENTMNNMKSNYKPIFYKFFTYKIDEINNIIFI